MDLDAIFDHGVAKWSLDHAIAYILDLERVFVLLSTFPEMARLRRELSPPIRIHPYRAHVIADDAEPVGIEIIRVLPARSDWVTYLR